MTDFSAILGKLSSTLINTGNLFFPTPNSKTEIYKDNHLDTSNLKPNNVQTTDKTQCGKLKDKSNILTIDLRKIEKISHLSDKEKINLKEILKNNRLKNKDRIRNKKNISRMAKVEEVTPKVMPTNNSSNNPFQEVPDSVSRKIDNSCKKSKNPDSKKRNRISQRLNLSTNKFQQPTMGSSNPFDHHLDKNTSKSHSACIEQSVCTTRNILRARPSINIKNLRLKYVNPTCFMQYITEGNEIYSCSALKAHLGQGQSLLSGDLHSDRPQRKNKVVNVDDHEDYVIARGTLTEEEMEKSFKILKKEVRRSLFPTLTITPSASFKGLSQPTSSTHLRGRSLPVNEISRSEDRKPTGIKLFKTFSEPSKKASSIALNLSTPMDGNLKKSEWEVDSFPSTLLNLEKDIPKCKKPVHKVEPQHQRNTSTLEKLRGCFMKTCFCLCFRGDSKSTYQKYYKDKSKVENPYEMPQTPFKNNLKVIRTTESKFFSKTPNTK